MKISFEPFTVDLETRQLLRADRAIHLSPKAFDLLATLAQARPRVIAKSAVQQHLWPKTFVAEANLSNLVAEIRGALGEGSQKPLFIRTAHGFDYALCGEAASHPGVGVTACDEARPRDEMARAHRSTRPG